MAFINKQDTNGVKGLLAKGELGYDDYATGGDAGRVYVGDGSENIPLAKKSEVDALAGGFSKVASGAISNGDTIIINADGTVSAVTQNEVQISASTGITNTFNGRSTTYIASKMLNDTEIVVAYCDSSEGQFGKIVKGTISGSTITFGSENTFNTAPVEYIDIEVVSDDTVFIGFTNNDNGYAGTLMSATFIEDSVVFSSHSVFNNSETYHISITSLADDVGIISFQDVSVGGNGTMIVGTLVGNEIVYGEKYVFNTGTTSEIESVIVDTNKVLLTYIKDDSSYQGSSRLAFISGDAITFGSEVIFSENTIGLPSVAMYDSNNFVITYQDKSALYYGKFIIGHINLSSITYDIPVIFNQGFTGYIDVEPISSTKAMVAYLDNYNNNYGTARIISYDGSTTSLEDEYVFNAGNVAYIDVLNIGNEQGVISFRDVDNSNYGTSIIRQEAYSYLESNLTTDNFIGFADGAVSDGENVLISKIGAIIDTQTGLTTGLKYYVQEDGTLATTPDITEVYAGLAISSTELIVKG